MKKITIISFLVIISSYSFGQGTGKYSTLINGASELYDSGEYLRSAKKYSEAFASYGGTLSDMYNAACSWALAGYPDSSFVQLFKIAEKGNYTDIQFITNDTDLNSLHQDVRWEDLLDIITSNRKNFDEYLVAVLDTILQEDQGYRFRVDEIIQKYGSESEEYYDFVKKIRESDSIHLLKVMKILDERGWLGPDKVGNEGNLTLFLVIQHSPPETQEKYLPMMREAVAKGNAYPAHLAMLEDRVAVYKGEKQIYGSQIGQDEETGEYYVLPLVDPDNVNQRRAEAGLDPIEEYVIQWGITWDVEEYKKKLPEYEAMQDKY